MLKLIIVISIIIYISIIIVYIIRLILKHNLFISKLIFKINFKGIHVEIYSKEKDAPSSQ